MMIGVLMVLIGILLFTMTLTASCGGYGIGCGFCHVFWFKVIGVILVICGVIILIKFPYIGIMVFEDNCYNCTGNIMIW